MIIKRLAVSSIDFDHVNLAFLLARFFERLWNGNLDFLGGLGHWIGCR